MDAVPGYRACYECPCGAYRWQKSAWQKGETHCLQCGTPFCAIPLRYYRKKGGGRTSSAAAQQYIGQWPKGGGKGLLGAKGAMGKGGKGPKGAGGRRPGPQQPGLQTSPSTAPGDGRSAAGAAQPSPNTINYNRASKDALYRARTHYEVMRGLWGDESAHAVAAKQALDEASRDALDRQPPAKKLAALRQEHERVLASISHGLQRCDQIEMHMGELQQEYYATEAALEQRAQRAKDLQAEIDAFEADLPQATAPGAQVGIRDQLHNLLHAHVRRSGKQFTDRQREHACDNIEELLKVFEEEPDAAMDEELDSLPALSDDDERAPKQRRARDRGPQAQAAETEEDDSWQQGLGAVGKKLARRGLLGKRTVQQLDARQTGQGGKAKGKGAAGKGKGKTISYSAALQSQPPPTATYASAAPAGAGGTASASSTGLPGAAIPPGGVVPAGGNLAGGWPQLGVPAATGTPAAQAPIAAADYTAHQAQLRRGEGHT